ncbi:coat F domain-containing protein [Hydrogenispora ethanolica]|jgi:spore coat protein CotF|uniref:Coat F domain-containing protein n=1 Tax=Hydrogenispora ethanolica TaxID=1082276 RepID=A0A4R1S9L1_HYDET|nr:spore coat protein [Hydrogenispora ethanolica]TCL75212.1 coat F domain-containing protein [Hydrogenispora ethanolica]
MYTDREMTLDALEIAKTGAVSFTQAATETSNPAIRQALLQMRAQCEQTQQQIGQYAQTKNYYKPAPPAPHQDVAAINQFLQQTIASGNLQ